MKYKIIITCLFFVILNSQCKKDSNNATDTLGLPAATQTGANTFGFLLNEVPWVPAGNNGSGNNLSIDYDPGIRNGICGIFSYNVINSTKVQYFGIGIDSLNFYKAPHKFKFFIKGALISNANFNGCILSTDEVNAIVSGQLLLDKYDKTNRIISGRFDYSFKNNCDSFKITNGRFDFKF